MTSYGISLFYQWNSITSNCQPIQNHSKSAPQEVSKAMGGPQRPPVTKHIIYPGQKFLQGLEMTELYPKFLAKLKIANSYHSTINAGHSGMWHCVIGQAGSSWQLGLIDTEDDNKTIDHVKQQSLLMQWHSTMLQKTESLASLLWEHQISQQHSDLGHSAHFTNTAVLLTCTMTSL